ncbi:MAG: hypothetical protein H6619_00065 [Deltaproteobacteria bacterium]|nr:hypothetical protein [Deltaproteobacteria bacterium]
MKEQFSKFCIAFFLAAFVLLVPKFVFCDNPEIPVLVNQIALGKTMFILDDSGSMISVVEHEDFDPTSAVATNSNNKIPALIFRNESGGSSPSSNNTLRPVLIEFNYLYNNVLTSIRGQVTGNLFETGTLSNASQIDSVKHMGCTTSSNYCCPSYGSCSYSNVFGINNAVWFENSSTKGPNVFQTSKLHKVGGNYQTDSNGHEYLYVNADTNDFYANNYTWGSYWPKFDSDGDLLSYSTRIWTTTGGTVLFNDKEVFLSAGFYRQEYLRWIFYGATQEQLNNLPGTSRIQLVKDVMEQLILNNPDVEFGIATLNGSKLHPGQHTGYLIDQFYEPEGDVDYHEYGVIRSPIGTDPATIISQLDLIGADGGTPLAYTYIETMRYFDGATANDPNCTICNYTSPINSVCDGHFVVLLTDGLPTSESSNTFRGNYIQDYDGDGEDGANSNYNCNSNTCHEFLDDAAKLAYDTDFSDLGGTQKLISYAVGMGLDFDLLDDFAVNGGTQTSLSATTAAQITNTLQQIVSMIINTPVSGAGVALAEAFGETGKVYRPRFRADNWTGNIDVFEYVNDELSHLFDMGDILEARDVTSSPRTIFAGYDPDHDGNTNQSIVFHTDYAANLKPELFELFYSGAEQVSNLATPLQNYTNNQASYDLIRYIHGIDQTGMRIRDSDADNNVEKLGDIVYSRPIEVGPKNGQYNDMEGYAEFVASKSSEPRLLLVGANDGMMHAFNSQTGEEVWAYIPSSQLKYLERLARPFYNVEDRRSFVDADVVVEDAYIGGQWKTLAMFGLRTGGSTYTVLDVTDRESPSLLFEISEPANYGESWTTPIVVPVNGPASSSNPGDYSWYMVVGTGENKPTPGSNIVVYNLNSSLPTGTVKTLSGSDPAGTRTATPVAVQTDSDLNADRIYVGTEEGDMYRINLVAGPGSWVVQKMYNGSSTQPIVAPASTVLVENPEYNSGATTGIETIKLAVGVYWGTGRYDTQSDVEELDGVTQSIIGMFDPVKTTGDDYQYALTNRSKSSLKNQSVDTFDVLRKSSGIYTVPNEENGFYIDLDTSINLTTDGYIDPVGMVIDYAVNVRGALLFTTFLPSTGQCDIGGYGFLQGVNFRTGGGVIVDYSGDAPFYNGGIFDADGDLDYDDDDLSLVYGKQLQAALDAHVESYDDQQVNPYIHDGLLKQNDIRLHQSNGGVLPSVSSIGNTGAPSSPAILHSTGQIIVQPAYPIPPSSQGGQTQSSDVPPPNTSEINIYSLPLSKLSFHETTGQ